MFLSKRLAKYLGSIPNLTGCYLCLTNVFFYFSSICIKKPKTKSSIFFVSCVLKEKSVKKVCALRIETNLPTIWSKCVYVVLT